MPKYIYKAKKGPEEIISGVIEAVSQEDAINRIVDLGAVPISVIEEGAGPQRSLSLRVEERKRVSLFKEIFGKINDRDINVFTRQLTSLVKANVPLLKSLFLISEQTENKMLESVISDLVERVRKGAMLSEAMSEHPKVFDKLYLSMILSGEKGGALYEVLCNLADYREREMELKREIQAAAAYPLFMGTMGIATIFVMFTFFLPKLIGLFENMRQALPLPTVILIGITKFASGNWYWFLLVVILGILLLGKGRQGGKRKFFLDLIKLHMPFMKKLVMNAEISRFAKTLGLLFKNGIPFYEGLGLAASTLDNDALRANLLRAGEEIVSQGLSLSASFKKLNVFPNFVINMISVGEESGRLDESLAEIASVYDKEVTQSMKIMTSLLEPLLIVIVGSVVGFIVFAMLLPLFNLGGITG
jgi:type II secretory pathway component PulF